MKLRESLPDDFTSLITDVKTIVLYLDKYCRSFYNHGGAPGDEEYGHSVSHASATYMETPFHYNLQRSEFLSAIINHLDNIPRLG